MAEPTYYKQVSEAEADAHYGQVPGAVFCPCHEARLVPLPSSALVIEDGLAAGRLRGARALAAQAGLVFERLDDAEQSDFIADAELVLRAAVGEQEGR